MKKLLIVYYSWSCGNTERIAYTINMKWILKEPPTL